MMENLSMVWHFVIRMWSIVLWVLSHFIYSTDFMSKWSHGQTFRIDWRGIRRSYLRNQAMYMRKLQINLIEKFAIRRTKKRDVNISVEHILVDMKDVN